jgi:23S rRNA pseudouridine1911/1915/1917 synthase
MSQADLPSENLDDLSGSAEISLIVETSEAIELLVTATDTDLRIDTWLTNRLPDFSRARLQKLITQGHVLVNDRPIAKKQKLQIADRVTLTVPPPVSLDLIPEQIPLDILYEDDQLIVINKPAGMVVHPAPGHSSGTLVHALLAYCPLAEIGGVHRPGIVHRLDRDTSGAIVVAKTDFAHQSLQGQIQAKTARREYLGVVVGSPREDMGLVDMPIGRHPIDRQKQTIVEIEDGGRSAQTYWEVLERIGNFTLIKFRLGTGRTHQIRVHSNRMGYPIVGDPVYGCGRGVKVKLPGQALHAWQLELIQPVTGETIKVEAPLPPHFEKLLTILRQQAVSQLRHFS